MLCVSERFRHFDVYQSCGFCQRQVHPWLQRSIPTCPAVYARYGAIAIQHFGRNAQQFGACPDEKGPAMLCSHQPSSVTTCSAVLNDKTRHLLEPALTAQWTPDFL
jgi:hypothetical protein